MQEAHRLRDCDALEDTNSTIRLQQVIDNSEILAQKLFPHRLQHLNRNHPVKPPPLLSPLIQNLPQIPIIAEQHLDLILNPLLLYPLLHNLLLPLAQRQGKHLASSRLHRQHRETPPPTANLKHIIPLSNLRIVDNPFQLSLLRTLEIRVVRTGVDGTGVGHVGREEGGKHFVGNVIVGGDVEAGGFGVVFGGGREERNGRGERAGEGGENCEEGWRSKDVFVADNDLEKMSFECWQGEK